MPDVRDSEQRSKYRAPDIYKASLIALNDFERSVVSQRILELLSDQDADKVLVGLLLGLSYSLGISVHKAMSLSPRDFNTNFETYLRSIPIDSSQWAPEENELHLFAPVIEYVQLELHPVIKRELKSRYRSNRKSKTLIREDHRSDVLAKIKRFVKEIRREHSSHISLDRIAAAVKTETLIRFQDPTLCYLLNGDITLLPPHTSYYYVPNLAYLESSWFTMQSYLWGEFPPKQLKLISGAEWNGYVLSRTTMDSFLEQAWKAPSENDLIQFHNWYTKYTITLLTWHLGHRAVRDPLCQTSLFDLESGFTLIHDKSKHGHKHLRILSIPKIVAEQYKEYIFHIKEFTQRVVHAKKDGWKNLEIYLRLLLSDRPSHDNEKVNARLFFLLSKDGKKLIPITPSSQEQYLRNAGLPVKPNFGRHHIASKLMRRPDISYHEMQFFLGHSLSDKTSKLSEKGIIPTIEKIACAIDSISKEDGWKPISGLCQSGLNRPIALKRFKIKDGFLPHRLPGYRERIEKSKQIEKQIKQLSEDIIAHLDEVYGKQSSNSPNLKSASSLELQNQFKNRILGLDFPHNRHWSNLKRHLREEFDGYNPLPNVLQFNSLSSGVSLLTESSKSKLVQFQRDRQTWVTWLNNHAWEWIHSARSKPHKYSRLTAVIILNAIFLGALVRRKVILGLANASYASEKYWGTLYRTNGRIHFEVFLDERYEDDNETFWEKRWLDRWIPDPVTANLIAIRNQIDINEIDRKEIEISTKTLIDHLQLSISKSSVIKSLASHGRSYAKLYQPGFIYALKSDLIQRRPYSLSSWQRLCTNMTASVDTLGIAKNIKKSRAASAEQALTPLEEQINSIYREILTSMNRLSDSASTTRKEQSLRIQRRLAELSAELPESSTSLSLFFTWAIALAARGMRGFSGYGKIKLKTSTLSTYILRLFKVLFQENKLIDYQLLTTEERTAEFKKIINSKKDTTYVKNLKQLLYTFDLHCNSQFDHGLCYWEELGGIPLSYRLSNSGSYVTEKEYHSLIERLLIEYTSSSSVEHLSNALVAILVYRFGLRPVEALKLKPNEILVDSAGALRFVIVTRNVLSELKSKHASRQVPLTSSLNNREKYVIENLYERALAYKEFDRDFTLTGLDLVRPNEHKLKLRLNGILTTVGNTLKNITSDSSVSTYSLRHAFATNHLCNILSIHFGFGLEWPQIPKLNISRLVGDQDSLSPLKSLSLAMGHKSTSVTLRTYSHCLDILDGNNALEALSLKDSFLANLQGRSIQAFRVQKHRLGTSEAVVLKYLAKAQLPSLNNRNQKKIKETTTFSDEQKIKEHTILDVLDVLLAKSSLTQRSNQSPFSQRAIQSIGRAIHEIQSESSLTDILGIFKRAKQAHLKSLVTWALENSDQLNAKLKSKTTRRRLHPKLIRFTQCLEPISGKWIVLNENETKSLTSLQNQMGIQLQIKSRSSSQKSVTETQTTANVEFNNHAANRLHDQDKRRKLGYQIDLDFSTHTITQRSLNLILITAAVFAIANLGKCQDKDFLHSNF